MRFQRFLFVQTAQVAGRFIHRLAEHGIMKNSLFPEKDNCLSLFSEFKIAFPTKEIYVCDPEQSRACVKDERLMILIARARPCRGVLADAREIMKAT